MKREITMQKDTCMLTTKQFSREGRGRGHASLSFDEKIKEMKQLEPLVHLASASRNLIITPYYRQQFPRILYLKTLQT